MVMSHSAQLASASRRLCGVATVVFGLAAPALAAHDTWTEGTAMPTARIGAAVGAIDGKIYVAGGQGSNGANVSANEIYDTTTDSWTTGTPMPTADWGVGAVVKKVFYTFGGQTGEVQAYDPSTNSWSRKHKMPRIRNSIAAAVYNDIIYVIGGCCNRLKIVQSYDPAGDSWSRNPPMLVGKSLPAAGVINSTILAAAGLTNQGVTGDNEAYDVSKNEWTRLAPDPTARQAGCSWGINGQLYFAGGTDQEQYGGPLNILEAFNPAANSWSTLTSMPHDTIYPGSAMVGKRLYCFGGYDPHVGVLSFVQIYQP